MINTFQLIRTARLRLAHQITQINADKKITQTADVQDSMIALNETALQDSCLLQLFVHELLISILMGSTLQDDIVNLIRTLHAKGHEILGTKSESDLNQEITTHHEEKNSQRTAATPDPCPFQLDRPPFNSLSMVQIII